MVRLTEIEKGTGIEGLMMIGRDEVLHRGMTGELEMIGQHLVAASRHSLVTEETGLRKDTLVFTKETETVIEDGRDPLLDVHLV